MQEAKALAKRVFETCIQTDVSPFSTNEVLSTIKYVLSPLGEDLRVSEVFYRLQYWTGITFIPSQVDDVDKCKENLIELITVLSSYDDQHARSLYRWIINYAVERIAKNVTDNLSWLLPLFSHCELTPVMYTKMKVTTSNSDAVGIWEFTPESPIVKFLNQNK